MSVRDAALNQTLRSQTVDVPEWGGQVVVKEMTAAQRERFITNRQDGYMYADVVLACVYDENDELLFDAADRDKLAAAPAGPLERLFGLIADMSAVTDAAVDEAKDRLKDDPFDGSS